MSNSIWKTKAIVPEENGKQILVKFQNNWWHTEKITRRMMREWADYYETGYLEWCYLDELLTQADKAERLQKQLDSLKKYSDSLRHRVEKMLKKNKTLKNTAADYFMKSIELGIELEKTKSNN